MHKPDPDQIGRSAAQAARDGMLDSVLRGTRDALEEAAQTFGPAGYKMIVRHIAQGIREVADRFEDQAPTHEHARQRR